ncbi:hypothetical protein SCP_1401750 [Sparassis crispa]|uniref:Uncharacterized protein n=1 Tax=Sparassis crispa TaxID=139825 RepID=A0A401H329_9APHY|nr:hypothetical protein SCP_1401750 [Sparassis crispa]GBE88770.1 hypothetical protein SCP_1401750 [Sparassis crispa]
MVSSQSGSITLHGGQAFGHWRYAQRESLEGVVNTGRARTRLTGLFRLLILYFSTPGQCGPCGSPPPV